MTKRVSNRVPRVAADFARREDGTTMIEFAISIGAFLLILFAILDFARLGYTWVTAEKAVQQAARTAAMRPAICDGVPEFHFRATGTPDETPSGTLCFDGATSICEVPSPTPSCSLQTALDLDPSDPKYIAADAVWKRMVNLVPETIQPVNVFITYEHDPRLGFVGGPYVPNIIADIRANGGEYDDLHKDCEPEVCFEFVTPLSALTANAAGQVVDGVPEKGGKIPYPAISATVPGEDINSGMNG